MTQALSLLLSPGGEGDLEDWTFRCFDFFAQPLADKLFDLLKSCHPMTPCQTSTARSTRRCSERWPNAWEEATPYQTRRSGPSIDRARTYRSLLGVQKRGQWRAHKSVVRYEKSARLAKSWECLDANFKAHAEWCEQKFGGILLGHVEASSFVATVT